jgi:hypothetical protein
MVSYAWVAFALLTARTVAQGVLSNGNSQFPACAQSCSLVNQAAQACGGTASADQGDVSEDVADWLAENHEEIPEDNIELIEDKKKKAAPTV